MSPDEDGECMARLQAGDDRALDSLMQRWEVPLRRFAERYLHNETEALDLAEETFVRVYRHRERFRPGSKFSTWLFAIALNLCRDRSRRANVRPIVFLDAAALARASDAEAGRAGNDSPDFSADRAERAGAVRAAVSTLPEPLRTAVLLCEFEGMSQADAAAVAGCTVKAIETRLYRARAELRKALANYL